MGGLASVSALSLAFVTFVLICSSEVVNGRLEVISNITLIAALWKGIECSLVGLVILMLFDPFGCTFNHYFDGVLLHLQLLSTVFPASRVIS